MFFWRSEATPAGGVYEWLLANKQEVGKGTAYYGGTRVTEATEFYQYKYVISLGVVSLVYTTPYLLPTVANGHLRSAPWKYSLISLLLGWWCIPWGPVFTVHAVLLNLRGGRKRTAANLLQLLEWGWDAPHDVSMTSHRKKLVEVSQTAAAEIRSRMAEAGFSEELGVRITPTGSAGSVEIAFDYPVSDGRDWLDQSQGLTLLVDKRHESQLSGSRLDFRDGVFFITKLSGSPGEADG